MKKGVYLSDGITSIGESAFDGYGNLRKIIIPEGVTSIGNSVFYDWGSLSEISMPKAEIKKCLRHFFICF